MPTRPVLRKRTPGAADCLFHRRLNRLLVFALGLFALLLSPRAHAQALESISFSPAIGTLKVSPAAGTVYTGAVVYAYRYPVASPSGSVFYGLPIGTNRALLGGMTNLYIAATGAPTYTVTSGSNCPINTKGATQPSANLVNSYVFAFMNGICTFTISVPVVISKDAGAVSGTFAGSQLRATASTMPCGANTVGWAVWWIEGGSCPAYAAPGTGSGSVVYPTLPYSNIGCTLTATSMTVNLPVVGRSSLATAGAVAGLTRFNIGLQGCTWTDAVNPLNVMAKWTFTQLGSSDTIATGVTNVGVQILDETLTPVVNGGSRSMFQVVNGTATYTKAYAARYIAVGGPANAGSFTTATATFDLTYN